MNSQVIWLQQILVGIITAAFASFFTTYLNNRYQRLREDSKWHKEKLFEAYSKCLSTSVLATQLARTKFGNSVEQSSTRIGAITELLTSLNILLVLCSGEQESAVIAVRDEIEQLLQSNSTALLNILPKPLESIRDKLIQLMQSDPKLKEFGQ
ncbi:hypothetical protein JOY44_25840 (plasmid) [Phormidium sp. CLA17]|uniref:hypothetical protein n=1 Tax=Leptolyngbya sp. Cla-17 TaxID=2803751 RepID=UPI001490BC43|nr:hypothetical protein [Leptolyngbya sp. Cla-17]MBM0744945.1 hypothetical protein [Leptolyngbya sp. Cla-17]